MKTIYTSLLYKLCFAICLVVFVSTSCRRHQAPKPRAYFRIEMPEKEYQSFQSAFPYTFSYPKYAEVIIDSSKNAEDYWLNLSFPQFNSQIHVSYKSIDDNFVELLEDSRRLAYKHTIKADAINELLFENKEHQVLSILYDIQGDAASPVQFLATDSVHHFLRGSLYFNSIPNKDSLAPVIDFIKEDMIHLIETIEWKNN
ncbi:gliding motility lipoprotein GldD [Carboxylicivirga sp. N1Y90]|uniref:gliding motility lipoprotein GldD n=1 Tax=Carboxylicivirga fragile TaxID=3417571 RepID=UPI003D346ACB|nr:gliding motility lipoprotein GldD [Marinilabiliaceae bacterium N1Y90]